MSSHTAPAAPAPVPVRIFRNRTGRTLYVQALCDGAWRTVAHAASAVLDSATLHPAAPGPGGAPAHAMGNLVTWHREGSAPGMRGWTRAMDGARATLDALPAYRGGTRTGSYRMVSPEARGGTAWQEFGAPDGQCVQACATLVCGRMRWFAYGAAPEAAPVQAAPARLTFASVRAELQAHGVAIVRTGCGTEIRVRIKGAPAGHGAFCDGLEDARGTGLAMAREAQRNAM